MQGLSEATGDIVTVEKEEDNLSSLAWSLAIVLLCLLVLIILLVICLCCYICSQKRQLKNAKLFQQGGSSNLANPYDVSD